MDPNSIRDNAVSNTQVEGLKTVHSWNSLHGSSGLCTPGCICSWSLDSPASCGDREREAMRIPGAAEAAKAAAEEASRLAGASKSAAEGVSGLAAAAGGSYTTPVVNASSGEMKKISSGPPSLNLLSCLTSTYVRATPALLSPTLGLPRTGACSPDCGCPTGHKCYDSTQGGY
jgi:hypothetical protein